MKTTELVLGLLLAFSIASVQAVKAEQVIAEALEKNNPTAPVVQKAIRQVARPIDRAQGRRPAQQLRRRLPQQQRAGPARRGQAIHAAGGNNPRPRRAGPMQKRPVMRQEIEAIMEVDDEEDDEFFVPFPYYLPTSRIIVDSGRRHIVEEEESFGDPEELEDQEEFEEENWFLPKDEDKTAPKKIVLAKSPHLDVTPQ